VPFIIPRFYQGRVWDYGMKTVGNGSKNTQIIFVFIFFWLVGNEKVESEYMIGIIRHFKMIKLEWKIC
jgi:hypothetical protein